MAEMVVGLSSRVPPTHHTLAAPLTADCHKSDSNSPSSTGSSARDTDSQSESAWEIALYAIAALLLLLAELINRGQRAED